ncbi:MAG TPA: serine hydrolase domain-containing protein [Thermoanaerobaculia bacterium]
MTNARIFVLAIALSAVASFSSAQALPPETVRSIEQQVSTSMSKYHFPASSVAIVMDDKLVWSQAFGTADLENLVPATSSTRFRLASVSKPITAIAVMQLVEAGKIRLDSPISQCVPQYKPAQVPTLRQLLTHTSGVRHYKSDDDVNDPEFVNTRHFASVTQSIDQFKNDPLAFAPGSSFLYSTHGFTLLGSCVEQVTKTPFVDYVTQNIFRPAGMTGSRDDLVTAIIPNRARPYSTNAGGVVENAPFVDTSNRIPGGGFISTASDMARLAISLFEGKVLRPDTVSMMFKPNVLHLPDGTEFSIALGWAVGGAIGRDDVVWMGGNQPGATAMVFVMPASRSAVVVLTNKGGEGGAVIELAKGIAKAINR